MASQTQFKQQCPSCEAMVPIKDSSLVGKKVECPKCKYRFLVEEPGEADSSADDAKDTKTKVKTKPDAAKPKAGDAKSKGKPEADDGKPKKKKKEEKKGPPVMLIAGVGLGLVAVVGLVVGAILLFGGGDSDKSKGSGSGGSNQQQGNSGGSSTPNRPNSPMGGGGMMMPGGNGPQGPGGTNNPAANGGNKQQPVTDHAVAAITNLLPNETQAVYSINIKKFLESSLGGGAFRSSSGFRTEMFRDGLGLPIGQMKHLVRAESLKNNWVFNVVQMFPTFTVKADAMKEKLGGQKGPKSPISGQEYFLVSSNDAMNSLSAIDFFSILNPKASPYRTVPATTMAWHIYDGQTLVVAEVNQMEQFLQSGRKPKHLTQTQESRPSGPGGYSPMGPGGFSPMGPMGGLPKGIGGGPMTPSPGLPSGTGPMTPMGGAGGAAAPEGAPGGAGGQRPGMYGPPMGAGGFGPMGPGGNQPGAGGLYTEKPTYLTINPDLKEMMDKMEEAREPVVLSCAGIDLENASSKIVDNIRNTTTLGALIPLPTIVSAGLGLKTMSEKRLTAAAAVVLRREDDARALHDTIQNSILEKASTMLGKWLNVTFDSAAQNTQQGGGFQGGFRPGGGSSPMGGFGGPPSSGSGGFSPMGGFGGPPSSGGGGISPGGGGGGPPSSGGGGFSPKGSAGGATAPGEGPPTAGGGMTPGRFGPGQGGFTPGLTPGSSKPSGSSLTSSFVGRVVYINLDAEITSETDQKIRQEVENQVIRLKGMTDVAANPQPRWAELARTAIAAKNQNRVLRGTHAIAEDTSGKSLISRGPSQRVSWMADLLPMLGKTDLYNEIDPKLPWRDKKNLRAAVNWVPEFINPQYPRENWQARLTSLPAYDLGATHYVGLSGVGLDSADWDDSNPATRKKLGMFGYDRETRFTDIPDGASNTIYMITVPPNVPRPWIAGGGATVQGVPEKNSIAPFVYNQGGKRGAYAVMADGSVRFLSAETPDKVFQAMVTKAGNDDVGDLDSVAPKLNVPAPAAPKSAPKAETSAATNAGDGWKDYVAKDGAFSVRIPSGNESDLAQDAPLPNGMKIKVNVHRVDAGANGQFGISYFDIPNEAAGANAEQFLNDTKNGFISTQKGAKIVGEKKITLGTNPGLEAKIEGPGGSLTLRIYVVNRRAYILAAGGGQGTTPDNSAKFFDSFKLLK